MSDTQKKNLVPILSIIGAVIVFFAILLMPLPQGMTLAAQKSLALFTFALIMWIAKPIPIYQTSIIIILLLPLIGAVKKQSQAFETLGYSIILADGSCICINFSNECFKSWKKNCTYSNN